MKFLVYAPLYNEKSAGIMMLYTLNDELKRLGYESEIILIGEIFSVPDDAIVIYPEVVDGNPLFAKNVVRYFLNREGMAARNKVNPSPNDFILAFNKLYYENPHATLRYEKLNPHCHFEITPNSTRKLDCTYIGKGIFYSDQCKVIPGTIEITRTAPLDKEALADLLKITKLFFTYDICSLINSEAIICGAIVVPLLFYPYNSDELEYPYAYIENGVVRLPEDYENKREAYISMIRGFDLESQTRNFASKAIAHFSINI